MQSHIINVCAGPQATAQQPCRAQHCSLASTARTILGARETVKAVVCPGPHGAQGRQERENLCHLQLKESEQVGAGEERDGMEKKGKRGCSSRAVVEMVPKTKHLGKS